ncbi:hypothetical protein KXV95_003186 [Aspergillus fumigatus]|nr:hypothetical protein KXX31_007169 [Aspergillus fumigatus]KAH2225605.1 hypothetical protein KXV37_007527 [Aspergillus fumigatus]KAH2689680.1 hypothetical protein KXV51_008543 [Aspergillus fumigatus]KAH2824623.1 hypothetical protein KXW76_004354 [Aspergillus fumigatus]KAH3580024.1 hypothetical protein KXV95_003186 [Aspergillus fumigatus]
MAMPSTPEIATNKRSVTCLKVGAVATATWVNSAGQSCSFVGVVGSNYGTNSAGTGERSLANRTNLSVIPVMADVAQDAQALHLAMRIPKTASPMISARILTMPVEGQVIPTAELLMMLQWMIFFLVSQMDVRRQIQLSF